jgi:hypothetical protein
MFMKLTRKLFQRLIREELQNSLGGHRRLNESRGSGDATILAEFAQKMQSFSRATLSQLYELCNLYNADSWRHHNDASEYPDADNEAFLDEAERMPFSSIEGIYATIKGIRGYRSNAALLDMIEVLEAAARAHEFE